LRACGQAEQAWQAEQRAAWARFELDEPTAARRLYAVTKDLRDVPQLGVLLAKALEGALALLGASRGNIQILDKATGSLVISAQCGFGAEFLDYFAVVDDAQSACGRAAVTGAQTVISDVTTDPYFAPHRAMAAASGFRAVQSTPLADKAGRVVGVVSTHYPHPYRPAESDLRIIKRYGELVGETIAKHHAG
jgi:GAF domain-containing protein